MFVLVGAVAISGCSVFRPNMSREREFDFGTVRLTDYHACQNLRVIDQKAGRDTQGRLEVRITWENISDKPFQAKIRRIFIDEQGLRERGAYEWDLQTFEPGTTTLSWKSYSVSAVHYRIEVRKAD